MEICNFKFTGKPTSQVLRALHTYTDTGRETECPQLPMSFFCWSFFFFYQWCIANHSLFGDFSGSRNQMGDFLRDTLSLEPGYFMTCPVTMWALMHMQLVLTTTKKASIIFKVLRSVLRKFCYASLFHPCSCLYTYLLYLFCI